MSNFAKAPNVSQDKVDKFWGKEDEELEMAVEAQNALNTLINLLLKSKE